MPHCTAYARIERVHACDLGCSICHGGCCAPSQWDWQAGTIAGNYYGIAKEATIIAVRVLGDDGSGSMSGVIAGLECVHFATSSLTRCCIVTTICPHTTSVSNLAVCSLALLLVQPSGLVGVIQSLLEPQPPNVAKGG
jgi:hypothetical protein